MGCIPPPKSTEGLFEPRCSGHDYFLCNDAAAIDDAVVDFTYKDGWAKVDKLLPLLRPQLLQVLGLFFASIYGQVAGE